MVNKITILALKRCVDHMVNIVLPEMIESGQEDRYRVKFFDNVEMTLCLQSHAVTGFMSTKDKFWHLYMSPCFGPGDYLCVSMFGRASTPDGIRYASYSGLNSHIWDAEKHIVVGEEVVRDGKSCEITIRNGEEVVYSASINFSQIDEGRVEQFYRERIREALGAKIAHTNKLDKLEVN